MLTGLHYTSWEILQLERERLFSRLWIFVGFASFVQQPNQYIARRIAGMPIVIQRTANGLLAYLNECPHRKMPIQAEGFGTRAMVCPYHGWSFNAAGGLHGLPNPGLYHFDEATCAAIKLRRFAARQLGPLVFVNLSPDPIDFDEQFDKTLQASIEERSAYMDDQILYVRFPVCCNWKLAMENVKDMNHVQFVHPRTFFRSIKRTGELTAEPVLGNLLQYGEVTLSRLSYHASMPLHHVAKSWFEPLVECFSSDEWYYNWCLYPNVNFFSLCNTSYSLQQFDPVTPDQTDYHLWIMAARRKQATTDFTAMLHTRLRRELNVITEDSVLLERLQSSLGAWTTAPRHGAYELPLIRQHRWYIEHVLQHSKGGWQKHDEVSG